MNPVNERWEEYWDYVLKVYEIISTKESSMNLIEPRSKAVHDGTMSIELVKISGEKLRRAIFRCVRLFHRKQDLPDDFQIEKMILLYKHKEKLDDLDNYKLIFLRLIIVISEVVVLKMCPYC